MKKQIFEKGDRVFHYLKGWGEIVHTYSDNWEEVDDNYTVCVVKFESSEELEHFTKYLATKMLSFTEYTLQGFTQEKPVNYEDYIGKWGVFWDKRFNGYYISKLKEIDVNNGFTEFVDSDSGKWDKFRPLTKEQIKILKSCD